MRPLTRAPLLGFGLGAVAGGLESVQIGAIIKLYLTFGEAAVTGLVAVLLDGLVGAALAIPVGVAVHLWGQGWKPRHQYAACMTGTAALLGLFFLVPAAVALADQGRIPAAVAFALAPLGVAGVVWSNATYWFRREEIGEEYAVGWRGWSLLLGALLALGNAWWLSQRTYGAGVALEDDPSVLLLTVDTLRRDHVSAYGESPVQTPKIDALAAQGVLFSDAMTPLPETAPAHAALLTGRHPVRSGMLSNRDVLSRSYLTLTEVLAEEGYATGAFVSAFTLDARAGLDQGFQVYDDDFAPGVRALSRVRVAGLALRAWMRFGDPAALSFLDERAAPVTTDRALEWVRRAGDRPVFLWVHLFEPHSPYEPHGMPGFEDNGTPGDPSVDHRVILAAEPGYAYTDAERSELRRLYQEEVAYTDQQVGRFLDALRPLMGERDLIVLFAGDHGEMLGEHGVDFNHHGVWDDAVRIPLIIVPNRLRPKTRVVEQQVRLMDVPATVLDLLRLDPMEKSEGVDLMGYAEGVRDQDLGTLIMGRTSGALDRGTLFGYRTHAAKYVWDADADTEHLA